MESVVGDEHNVHHGRNSASTVHDDYLIYASQLAGRPHAEHPQHTVSTSSGEQPPLMR